MIATFESLPVELRAVFNTNSLPGIGVEPRKERDSLALLESKLDDLSHKNIIPSWSRSHIRCLAYLWHDYVNECHKYCQDNPSPEASYLHGIIHRREPDFSNAKYWFRQSAMHPIYMTIGAQVKVLLDSTQTPELAARLLVEGEWNPIAFVDACAQVFKQPATDPRVLNYQKIQDIEYKNWLAYFCSNS